MSKPWRKIILAASIDERLMKAIIQRLEQGEIFYEAFKCLKNGDMLGLERISKKIEETQ